MGLASHNGRLVGCVLPTDTRAQAMRALKFPTGEDEPALAELSSRIRDYFDGKCVDFGDTPVDLDVVSPFARRALLECRKVPYGNVVTYAEIARRSGSPGACRAVGNAMAHNPVPIIIPCHRVVSSGGGLGGYSAGLDVKRRLLELEGAVFLC